jgi:hypothetical protein
LHERLAIAKPADGILDLCFTTRLDEMTMTSLLLTHPAAASVMEPAIRLKPTD